MFGEGEGGDLELRDYLRILRHRRRAILLVVLAVMGGALAASLLQTPVYQATAEVLPQGPAAGSTGAQTADSSVAQRTQLQIVTSEPVRALVAKKLGRAPGASASSGSRTQVVEISARSAVPKRAADVANAYASAYIEYTRSQANDEATAAAASLQPRIADLQKQVDDLNAQLASAPLCVDTRSSPSACAQRQSIQQGVDSRRALLLAQQTLYQQRLSQLQLASDLSGVGARLVNSAQVPSSPVSPKTVRNGVLAAAVGLLLGTGLAFLLDYLDDRIKSKEDLDRAVPGLPTLGLVPTVTNWRTRSTPRVVSLTEPSSPPAEAYRTLRTAMQFMSLDAPMRTVQITSPDAVEGKTTTVANLGVALARSGQRVLIVDGDLRRPRVHTFFGLTNTVGLTSVLLGEAPLSEAAQVVPIDAPLMLLASGPLPPNPSELLGSLEMVRVLEAVREGTDVVLIDCPPVLPVTDAVALSRRVDATLLVATMRTTTRRKLARAVDLLRQVEAPLVAMILNEVTRDVTYSYSYNYRYYLKDEGGNGAGPDKRPQEKAHRS